MVRFPCIRKRIGIGIKDMETLSSVMEWDIVFENCWWMWIICPLFFAIALVMRRSEDRTRKICGNVLLGFSIPGVLAALAGFGLFLYSFFRILSTVNPATHIVNDIKLGDDFCDLENSSLFSYPLMILLFPLQGIASVITGGKVLSKGSGKAIGTIAVIMGIALIAAAIYLAAGYLHMLADP